MFFAHVACGLIPDSREPMVGFDFPIVERTDLTLGASLHSSI